MILKKQKTEKTLSLSRETLSGLEKVTAGLYLTNIEDGYSNCETCNPR